MFQKIICKHFGTFVSVILLCMMLTLPTSPRPSQIFSGHYINILWWPDNSLELNSIGNAWNNMKDKVEEGKPNNTNALNEVLKKLWCITDPTCFNDSVESMPKWMQAVIKYKGNMTKYWLEENIQNENREWLNVFCYYSFDCRRCIASASSFYQ